MSLWVSQRRMITLSRHFSVLVSLLGVLVGWRVDQISGHWSLMPSAMKLLRFPAAPPHCPRLWRSPGTTHTDLGWPIVLGDAENQRRRQMGGFGCVPRGGNKIAKLAKKARRNSGIGQTKLGALPDAPAIDQRKPLRVRNKIFLGRKVEVERVPRDTVDRRPGCPRIRRR